MSDQNAIHQSLRLLLTFGVGESVVIGILYQHVCEFQLRPVNVLPSNYDRKSVTEQALEMGQQISDLCRE